MPVVSGGMYDAAHPGTAQRTPRPEPRVKPRMPKIAAMAISATIVDFDNAFDRDVFLSAGCESSSTTRVVSFAPERRFNPQFTQRTAFGATGCRHEGQVFGAGGG